mmetsp:Transcript_32498/g.76346  ORF Transcript_32498/g.76346 Transcript_32498/m.76346 type:complete len:239 (-) Transcript_32498:520-1236(-)
MANASIIMSSRGSSRFIVARVLHTSATANCRTIHWLASSFTTLFPSILHASTLPCLAMSPRSATALQRLNQCSWSALLKPCPKIAISRPFNLWVVSSMLFSINCKTVGVMCINGSCSKASSNHFSKIRFAKVTMKSSFASPILTRHTSSTRDRLCPKSTFTRSYTSSGLISSVTLIAAAWEDIRAEVAVECIRDDIDFADVIETSRFCLRSSRLRATALSHASSMHTSSGLYSPLAGT